MLTVRLIKKKIAMPQRKFLCHRLGFSRRVSSATTAALGRPNDITPAGKPAMVQNMACCFCSIESVSKWRPLPCETAMMAVPTLTQQQICNEELAPRQLIYFAPVDIAAGF